MVGLHEQVVADDELLGPQLVSLRLEGRLDLGVAAAASTDPRWSLGEVAARFPRLRYLQVDMSCVRRLLPPLSFLSLVCQRVYIRNTKAHSIREFEALNPGKALKSIIIFCLMDHTHY